MDAAMSENRPHRLATVFALKAHHHGLLAYGILAPKEASIAADCAPAWRTGTVSCILLWDRGLRVLRTSYRWGIAVLIAGCFGGERGNGPTGSDASAPVHDAGTSARHGAMDAGTPPPPDQQGMPCGVTGRSVSCSGPGGCAGGQVCQGDGTFGACDCGVQVVDGGLIPVDGGTLVDPPVCGSGAPCTTNADCVTGLFCVPESAATYSVGGLPGGASTVDASIFAGGVCSATPLEPYGTEGACDPVAPVGGQGCGDCGVCGVVPFPDGDYTLCAEGCTPSLTSTGCSRPGYTCDLRGHTCTDGCTTDEICRIRAVDLDGDLLPDQLQYDKSSTDICDPATLRCTNPGDPDAEAGDPCLRNEDCEPGGVCYGENVTFFENPMTGGLCSKWSCDTPGFECAGEGECMQLRNWNGVPVFAYECAHPCTQGMEPESAQLGSGGHGDTCRDGYMCLWGGGIGDRSGACMAGNYNAVTKNNVWTECESSPDCYSPMGHGVCVLIGLSGGTWQHRLCTIMDCGAPGLPDDVCGSGNTCVNLDNERTLCVGQCDDASTCPSGFGCIDHDARALTPNICFPACANNGECRPGETCGANGICAT